MFRSLAAWFLFSLIGSTLQAEAPAQVQEDADKIAWGVRPGVSMTRVAQQPAIQTPTGIDVDQNGNI